MDLAVGQSVSTEILDEIVERLVALSAPVKIILFGSNARGEAQPDSDLDLIVVEEEVTEQQDEVLRLDRALSDLMLPIDLIVVSETQLKRYGTVPGTVYYHSLREGRVLYAR
jgi:predicted nucleotidyltransferase